MRNFRREWFIIHTKGTHQHICSLLCTVIKLMLMGDHKMNYYIIKN